MKFYVYEWFNVETNEIFYVGKGCKDRYKSLCKRNKLFLQYYQSNKCSNRIIKYFDDEQDALNFENKRILELKLLGQCKCNLDNGGVGGKHFIWTEEMRKYKSKYNPMKREEQRNRMKINNPMKNKEIVEKSISKKRKKVIIGETIFNSLKEASEKYGVDICTIKYWIERGYDRNHKSCYLFGYNPKPIKIRTHITTNKPIIIDNIYFNSIKEGAEHFNISVRNLSRALNLNKTKCKGHICEYVNQQPSISLND